MRQQSSNLAQVVRLRPAHGEGHSASPASSGRRRALRLTLLFSVLALAAWLANRNWTPPETDPALAPVAAAERSRDIESLRAAFTSENPAVAARAVAGLASVAGQEARADLERALSDRRPEIRHAAASEFARVTDRHNVAPLNSALASDKEPHVRAAAARSLGELRSWNGLDRLLAAMDDPDPFVRRAAADAVQRILGLRFQFDPHGQQADRRCVIATIRAELPRLRPAYEAYMRKLESAQESTP